MAKKKSQIADTVEVSKTRVLKKTSNENLRFDRLDALRGVAIIWMTIFHFCFDLNHFGFLQQNFYEDPFWTQQRTMIVTLFLFCAGAGQAVAFSRQLTWLRFFNRWRQIAGASILVSIGSYLVYPQSFIYFGILHAIAVMLVIVKLTAQFSNYYFITGLAIVGLKLSLPSLFEQNLMPDFLNEKYWNWLGLISRKPITEDYVPLIPWLGVLFIGYAIAAWILKNREHWFTGELKSNLSFLAVLGRWSLSYYLIHQPVLFGLVMLARKII
jgi:uncharacterized membrane protein